MFFCSCPVLLRPDVPYYHDIRLLLDALSPLLSLLLLAYRLFLVVAIVRMEHIGVAGQALQEPF